MIRLSRRQALAAGAAAAALSAPAFAQTTACRNEVGRTICHFLPRDFELGQRHAQELHFGLRGQFRCHSLRELVLRQRLHVVGDGGDGLPLGVGVAAGDAPHPFGGDVAGFAHILPAV